MSSQPENELIRYINLKLASLGLPTSRSTADTQFLEFAGPLLRNYHQKDQLLGDLLCPADARIQAFVDDYLHDLCPSGPARIPVGSFMLDRAGMARVMSLPPGLDSFSSPSVNSYRVPQGILHNPKSDRRTTQGVFHIAEGGLPVPADKAAVPKEAFAALWAAALRPPQDLLTLPFTADQEDQVRCFVSLLLRPMVCPAAGTDPAKTMEIRFLAPGSLVSNRDFVESIFGNAGDPYLPENDAALDVLHWTGHSGCVVLAPHLVGLRKKDVGLPHVSQATDRQRRDGMCWAEDGELYNNGGAFKLACRDHRGVMVTIIADNYFGYCKKEVKTQISFAANLYGLCEEEHAGGAIAFATYVLGQEFYAAGAVSLKKAAYTDAIRLLGDTVEEHPEGYAVDRRYPSIHFVPEDAYFNVLKGLISWRRGDREERLTLRLGDVYFLPGGFRVRLEKQLAGTAWRLVGARPRGWRRHTESCPHKDKGRAFLKCNYPLWADGHVNGRRTLRQSLESRDLARTRKKAVDLESPDEGIFKPVPEATKAFLEHCQSEGLQFSTYRKYRNSLQQLVERASIAATVLRFLHGPEMGGGERGEAHQAAAQHQAERCRAVLTGRGQHDHRGLLRDRPDGLRAAPRQSHGPDAALHGASHR